MAEVAQPVTAHFKGDASGMKAAVNDTLKSFNELRERSNVLKAALADVAAVSKLDAQQLAVLKNEAAQAARSVDQLAVAKNTTAAAAKNLKERVSNVAQGASQLTSAMGSSNAAIGQFGGAISGVLGSFAAGGIAGAGLAAAIAGVAELGKKFTEAQEKAERARQKFDEAMRPLIDARDAAQSGVRDTKVGIGLASMATGNPNVDAITKATYPIQLQITDEMRKQRNLSGTALDISQNTLRLLNQRLELSEREAHLQLEAAKRAERYAEALARAKQIAESMRAFEKKNAAAEASNFFGGGLPSSFWAEMNGVDPMAAANARPEITPAEIDALLGIAEESFTVIDHGMDDFRFALTDAERAVESFGNGIDRIDMASIGAAFAGGRGFGALGSQLGAAGGAALGPLLGAAGSFAGGFGGVAAGAAGAALDTAIGEVASSLGTFADVGLVIVDDLVASNAAFQGVAEAMTNGAGAILATFLAVGTAINVVVLGIAALTGGLGLLLMPLVMPIAALAAGMMSLAVVTGTMVTQTETFGKIKAAFDQVVGRITEAFEPLAAQFYFVIPMFEQLVNALLPLVEVLTSSEIGERLFAILRTFAMSLLYAVGGVETFTGHFFDMVDNLIDVIQTVADTEELQAFEDSVKAREEQAFDAAAASFAAAAELATMSYAEAQAAGAEAVSSMEDEAEEAADTMARFNQDLVNIPSGYKVAGAEWGAAAPGRNGIVVEGDVVVHVAQGADARRLMDQLRSGVEARAFRGIPGSLGRNVVGEERN